MSEKARVRWLCRRGMKELDVLLEPFVVDEYDHLSATERESLDELLQLDDPDLYARVMQRVPPDHDTQGELLERIRVFRRP